MKKITLTSILALCMACPAMANIDKDASTATCDNATIGTTTGPANLQADWTANTIHLDWYSNDTKQTSTTCTYDGGITLPSTPTVPTGYTFGGWKVRVPFSLSGLDATIGASSFAYHKGMVEGDYCVSDWQYVECSDSKVSDLNKGEWKIGFDYGTVIGTSLCSSTSGTQDTAGTPDENTEGQGCWCKITRYVQNTGNTISVTSSWVFNFMGGDGGYWCAENSSGGCTALCASRAVNNATFRSSLFGQSN